MNNLIMLLALLVACVGCTNGYIYCYFCGDCPVPFNPNSPYVTRVVSNTNFCAKKSYSNQPGAPNSLGGAEPGLCVVNGCRWVYNPQGQQVYTCCCNSDYCNGSM